MSKDRKLLPLAPGPVAPSSPAPAEEDLALVAPPDGEAQASPEMSAQEGGEPAPGPVAPSSPAPAEEDLAMVAPPEKEAQTSPAMSAQEGGEPAPGPVAATLRSYRVNWRFDGFRPTPLVEGDTVMATEEEAAPYVRGVLTLQPEEA